MNAEPGGRQPLRIRRLRQGDKAPEHKRGFRPQVWRYRWDDFNGCAKYGRRTVRYGSTATTPLPENCQTLRYPRGVETTPARLSEVRYQWLGMALSTSEKRYQTAARRYGSSGTTGADLTCCEGKPGGE